MGWGADNSKRKHSDRNEGYGAMRPMGAHTKKEIQKHATKKRGTEDRQLDGKGRLRITDKYDDVKEQEDKKGFWGGKK